MASSTNGNVDLSQMKVADLRSIAAELGVELPKRATKAQIIEAITPATPAPQGNGSNGDKPLEQLLQERAEATSPGVKAALTKAIQAAGGTVPGARGKLTADAINEAREDGDTVDALLDRLGLEPNAARKARVAYLVNRAQVEEFATAE